MDEASSPARLLLADDHELIRMAVRTVLQGAPDVQVVGEARDGREAVELCRRLRPDLVLIDVQMPGTNGLRATGEIKEEHPEIVLMVTAFEDADHLLEAIEAGAAGYVLKHASRDEILGAVRGVLAVELPFDQKLAPNLPRRLAAGAHDPAPGPSPGPLTARELEVLALLAAGETNRGIAGRLHLSLSTVKGHIERIIAKHEVSDRTQAAVKAVEFGLIGRGEG